MKFLLKINRDLIKEGFIFVLTKFESLLVGKIYFITGSHNKPSPLGRYLLHLREIRMSLRIGRHK